MTSTWAQHLTMRLSSTTLNNQNTSWCTIWASVTATQAGTAHCLSWRPCDVRRTADHERKKPTNGVAKSMMTNCRKDLSVEMKLVRFQENEDTKNGPDRLASDEKLETFETPTIGNEHETDRRADNPAKIEGKIHEYRELHLMNLRIVDNTDLDHLLSHQETLDAERTIITNEILETDNTVKRTQETRWNRPRQARYHEPTDADWEQAHNDFVQWWDEQVMNRGFPPRQRYTDHQQEPTYRQRAPWRQHQRHADYQTYTNPRYQPPRDRPRWVQQQNGYWLDTQPQWPWESIFYNQPRAQRVYNERYLYGYSFDMDSESAIQAANRQNGFSKPLHP